MFENILLALVQGLTEFLPVSSSGHLILIPEFFGWDDPGLDFSAFLHFGTLLAVVVYFWKDWMVMFGSLFAKEKTEKTSRAKNTLFMLVIATIPGALIGFFYKDILDVLFRNPSLVALLILIGSLVLWLADVHASQKEVYQEVTYRKAFFIGMTQIASLLPGVSRSGITIATGLFLGMSRHESARFSFLMATPIIFGASILSFGDVVQSQFSLSIIFTFLLTFLSAYAVIALMLRWIEQVKYQVFVWYGIFLAGMVFFFLE